MSLPTLDEYRREEEARITEALTRSRVVPNLIPGLARHFAHHIEPGGFLRSVLENNLYESFYRAKGDSFDNLKIIVDAIHQIDLPQAAFRSKENVEAWLKAATS